MWHRSKNSINKEVRQSVCTLTCKSPILHWILPTILSRKQSPQPLTAALAVQFIRHLRLMFVLWGWSIFSRPLLFLPTVNGPVYKSHLDWTDQILIVPQSGPPKGLLICKDHATCHKQWTEISEIRQVFKWDLIKFCEIFTKITLKLPPK